MKYLIIVFFCMASMAASVSFRGPTRTRKGSRDSMRPLFIPKPLPAASRSFRQPGRLVPSPKRTALDSRFGRLTRPAAGGLFGGNAMQRLLPLMMSGEGEGLMQILLVASLVKGPNTSDQIKFMMLSGRFGEEGQIFGRCVFIMRLSKQQCIIYTLMNQ